MTDGLARLGAALVFVAHNLWVLWPWLDGSQIMHGGLISELAADTRPGQLWLRAADVVAGAIIVTAAVVGAQRWRVGWPRLLAVAVATTGVGIAGDAIFNLNCSATVDAACHATGDLATQPWQHQVHAFTSVLYISAMIASLAIVALSGRGRWRVAAIVLLGLQVVANVVLAFSDLLGRDQLTWLQGVSVVATAGWLAALVWALATRSAGQRPRH